MCYNSMVNEGIMLLPTINEVTDSLGYFFTQPTKRDLLLAKRFAVSPPTSHHTDAYTQAATEFYELKKVEQLDLDRGRLENRPRLVLEGGKLRVSIGYSRVEQIFYTIFSFFREKLFGWESENTQTVRAYQKFLIKECGAEKVEQIEKTYLARLHGLDLKKMIENGVPLEPRHVYLFNIGMNNIEDIDARVLHTRIKTGKPLTGREQRAINKLDIELETIKNQSYEESFATLMQILETPIDDWKKLYTGREFDTFITGSYNKKIFKDRNTFRPWVDQQELLQVLQTLKNPFSENEVSRKEFDHFFFEMITKVVVKKHLMRQESDGSWRVGAIIPSPYKNKRGETIYYRVKQGVDSGFGKFWYVFEPINDDGNLPIIRSPRDTSTDGCAQRGLPSANRDLSKEPGKRYADTTKEKDAAFFKQFTLPAPLAYLAAHQGAKNFEEIHKRFLNDVDENTKKALQSIYPKIDKDEKYFIYYKEVLKLHYDEDDWKRFEALSKGQKPRSFASIGNSLGGFDAMYDVVVNTAQANRVPITNLDVFTHSSLKISTDDNDLFVSFINEHKPLLDQLEVKLSIAHYTEKDDPVTQYPAGTLLGNGLHPDIPVDFQVVKFRTKQEAGIHMRRIKHQVKGKDYDTLPFTIDEYDAYGKQRTIFGVTLGTWYNLITNSPIIGRVIRMFWNRGAHVPALEKDKILDVTLQSNGSSRFGFTSQPTQLN